MYKRQNLFDYMGTVIQLKNQINNSYYQLKDSVENKLLLVEEKIKSLDEVKTAEVEITFDPPWTQELMSEEAKLELGML